MQQLEPRAFQIGLILSDTPWVRREIVRLASGIWSDLESWAPTGSTFEAGHLNAAQPVSGWRFRRLDWQTLQERVSEDVEFIEVRTVVTEPPRTIDEVRAFKIPVRLSVHFAAGYVRVIGHAFPTMHNPPESREQMSGALEARLLAIAEATDALLTGFITVDYVVPDSFPYEVAVLLNPYRTDWSRWIPGYYWGNFLSRGHLAEVDIAEAAEKAGMVVERGSGWLWVRLPETYPRCDRSALHELRAILSPVVPDGSMTVEEYFAQGPPYIVHDLCL